MIKVSIYNEFIHEKAEATVKAIYPDGIHMTLKEELQSPEIEVKTFTLDTVEDITEDVLNNTDVFIWWGHMAHNKVPDEVAIRVRDAVLKGMGMIFLHSSHVSKPFKMLMGTPCSLGWREDGDKEYLWICDPSHPIAKGLDRYIVLSHEETYSEPFCIPEPEKLVFIGSYEGGEAFRSGCCYHRGYGKVFYFQPGHETYPIYKNSQIITIIKNAIKWAEPDYRAENISCPNVKKIEE